jgi:hypothetical protein
LNQTALTPFLPRTGTRAYQPSDQDLTTLTRPRLDLIRSIGLRSGGQDYADAPAAVQVAGDALPRRRYAGDGQTWPSGLRLARDHAVEEAGGTGNPPGLSSCGSGLGWAIPAARAARGGGHAGVRAFRAQSSPNHYGFRCITTRQGRGSSPRACEGRSCRGGRTPTTTGGGNGAALADSSAWCSSRPAGPPNHHVQAL